MYCVIYISHVDVVIYRFTFTVTPVHASMAVAMSLDLLLAIEKVYY